jgi:hypothetical protein
MASSGRRRTKAAMMALLASTSAAVTGDLSAFVFTSIVNR